MKLDIYSNKILQKDSYEWVDSDRKIYIPNIYKQRLSLSETSRTLAAMESFCLKNRISYVMVDPTQVIIVSDYLGWHHLYVWQHAQDGTPILTITDDPLDFKGKLSINMDIIRLVPVMKYVPLPLSIISDTKRILPATKQVYNRTDMTLSYETNMLKDILNISVDSQCSQKIRQIQLIGEIKPVLNKIVNEIVQEIECKNPHVFLSGGMDSALLIHLIKQQGCTPRAWTAIFNTYTGATEKRRAKASAKFFGVEWKPVLVDKDESKQYLDSILKQMIEPFTDVATLAETILGYTLMQEKSESFHVFEGEGMDSLMCGSYKFIVEKYRNVLLPIVCGLPSVLFKNVDRKSIFGAMMLKLQQMQSLLMGTTDFDRHTKFLIQQNLWDHIPSKYQEEVISIFRYYYDLLPNNDMLNRLAMMTYFGNLPNLENRKLKVVERYSGIRYHLPYEDIRFIGKALSIPSEYKVKWGYGKSIMKSIFQNDLPPHTITRKKYSFTPPIFDTIYPDHKDMLYNSNLFDDELITRLIQEQLAGTNDHLSLLWGVFVTNYWIKNYS